MKTQIAKQIAIILLLADSLRIVVSKLSQRNINSNFRFADIEEICTVYNVQGLPESR